MTDTQLERYKDALRSGHVAALRGRLEEALDAYGRAAGMAADRAAPRTAIGGIQLRLGNPSAALDAFDEALALAPDDDAALHGRTQALVALERPADAAAAFDRLAEARAAAGKLAEACDALRRALEIETSGARRHRYHELARELRLVAGDDEAERALARALRLLEDAPAPSAEGAAEERTSEAPVAPAASAEPAPDGEALAIAADEAARHGDGPGAVAAAMAAARAFEASGHRVAALEACLEALPDGPDDVSLHLLIAELQVASGWPAVAGETYRNLLRLAELDGDPEQHARIAAAARTQLPHDHRFADLDV